MFPPGVVLGKKYRLDRLLGQGGMGAVYAAENLNTGRRVALKVLHSAMAAHPEASARFVREARATTSIAHPNIVEVLDLDSDSSQNVVYIVHEYLEGETLEERLSRQADHRLPPVEVVAIAVPVMEALGAAHQRGIVHRDLKPGNIFLVRRADGNALVKVIDFGVAKVIGPADWAMGVVLYEALCGRLPYEAENSNLMIGKILYESPTPIASHAPTLPKPLTDLIDRALQRDRTRRFTSIAEMLDSLRGVELTAVPQRSGSLAPTMMGHPLANPPTQLAAPPLPPVDTLQWQTLPVGSIPNRELPRWQLLVAAIGTLTLVVIAAALSAKSRDPSRYSSTPSAERTIPAPAAPPRTTISPPPDPAPASRLEPALRLEPAPTPMLQRPPAPVALPSPNPAPTRSIAPVHRARRAPRSGDGPLPLPPSRTELGVDEM
jgi:serine/threonine protein kinase